MKYIQRYNCAREHHIAVQVKNEISLKHEYNLTVYFKVSSSNSLGKIIKGVLFVEGVLFAYLAVSVTHEFGIFLLNVA